MPVLEVALCDRHVGKVGASTPRDRRHLRAWLDRVHGDASLREHHRRLAGAGADLEGAPGARKRDHFVDEGVRIRRPDAVVALGDLPEHQPRLTIHARESISSVCQDGKR
jgi:hypothetical protein